MDEKDKTGLKSRAKASLVDKTDRVHAQFGRYVVSGGAAMLLDLSLFSLLVKLLHVHYLIANPISFLAANLSNYMISTRWVFSSRAVKNRFIEYGIFILIGLGGLAISQSCLWAGVEVVGLDEVVAKVCTILFTVGWNFTMRKTLLFHKKPSGGDVGD